MQTAADDGVKREEFILVNRRDGETAFKVPVSLPPRVLARLEEDKVKRERRCEMATALESLQKDLQLLLVRGRLYGGNVVSNHLKTRLQRHVTKLDVMTSELRFM